MPKDMHIHDRILFFLGLTGILTGVLLGNIFKESAVFILVFVCIASIQILFFFRSVLLYISVFILFSCIGGYMSMEKLHEIRVVTESFEKETDFFTQEKFITGTLTEKVSENNKNARYILRNLTIGKQTFPEKTGILLTFPDGRGKNIDDIIAFTGIVHVPVNTEMFDYRTYLLLNDVYATVSVSFPDKVGTRQSPAHTILMRRIREKLLKITEDIYPGESAKLLEGILIGERADIAPETKKNFNSAGLTHIIAVSGFNITIILIFLSFLFRSFPIYARIFLALVCVGFFTFLVGPQISVLRASVFGLIAYVALLFGKRIRAFSVLVAMATVFVLFDPLVLNHDVSFHLSFLAVFWLLFFGDFFNRIFSFLPKWFGLRESLAMCLAAMVFTIPVVMLNFWQVSLVSPLVNIAVVPLIPLIMLGGFLSMIGALFSPHLGVLIGFPVWLWLRYVLQSVAWFGSLPYAAIPVELGAYKYVFEIGYLLTGSFLVLFFQDIKECEVSSK